MPGIASQLEHGTETSSALSALIRRYCIAYCTIRRKL